MIIKFNIANATKAGIVNTPHYTSVGQTPHPCNRTELLRCVRKVEDIADATEYATKEAALAELKTMLGVTVNDDNSAPINQYFTNLPENKRPAVWEIV